MCCCPVKRRRKSAVIWSITHQLAPAIADDIVQLWGIDPKPWNSAGEPLFTRLAYESPANYAETLEDAVVVMWQREVRLRG
jgi:hypothetical protein